MRVEFRVLGPLEVRVDGQVVPVPAGQARVVLATLLLRANRFVSVDELIDRLWDGEPPNPGRAKTTLQMVVTRLRQALGDANCVRTMTGGYIAELGPEQLDLTRFRALVASKEWTAALALWRGPVLVDVVSDHMHREEVPFLREEQLSALERRIENDLDYGFAGGLVPELRALTQEHPLHERFWGQLMMALYRAGQRSDALAAYLVVRDLLVEELGIEPSEALRDLHRRMLAAEPEPVDPPRFVPRQLPPPPRQFVGRKRGLDRLTSAMEAGSTSILAISGIGGVGKTALAVHWAYRVADRYPDGQLYCNLRGFDPGGEPASTDEALRIFLIGLRVAVAQIPPTVDEKTILLRQLLADRSVLVLLDNARDAEHVRPLLQMGPRCLVIVTSRNSLTGLVVRDGADPLALDLLDDADALALLERRLGAERVATEPQAAADAIVACAGLPLALAVVAARAAVQPWLPMASLVGELADERTRLDALDAGDQGTSVRSAFSWSYHHLGVETARAFRFLSLHRGPDITIPAVASLLGMPLDRAKRVLGELTSGRLLTEHHHGRFVIHDLLRTYAASLVESDDETERRAATVRLLDFYLHSTDKADRIVRRNRPELPLTEGAGALPIAFPDRESGFAWLEAEHQNLVASVATAVRHGLHEYVWQLPSAMWPQLNLRQNTAEWTALTYIAMTAARALDDSFAVGLQWHMLGILHNNMGEYDEALKCFEKALCLREQVDHRQGICSTAGAIASLYARIGRYADAAELYERVLNLARELDPASLTLQLNNYAVMFTRSSDYARALPVCREAMAVAERHNLDYLQAPTKDTLGMIYAGLGRDEEALREYREVLNLPNHLLTARQRVFTLGNMASVLERRGDVVGAREALGAALHVLEKDGNPRAEEIRERLVVLGGPEAGESGMHVLPERGEGA